MWHLLKWWWGQRGTRVESTFFNRQWFLHLSRYSQFVLSSKTNELSLIVPYYSTIFYFSSSSDKQCSLLLTKNLFGVISTRIVYLFFITFFVDSHLMFFSWFNIFKLHNKDSGTRSRVTEVGKEFIVFIFIYIFWMNLSVSSYLCFLVIVWTLFRHFIDMNWLESVLYLSCGYFHEWQQIDVRIIWLVEVRWQFLFESAFRHHGTVWWYQCLMWQQMW